MTIHAREISLHRNTPSTGPPWIHFPPRTARRRPATPNVLIAFMLAHLCFIPRPIAIASGTVAAIVKSPHELSASAFTTTSASTARMMTRMASVLTSATNPAKGPTSSRTIRAKDFPLRRTEQNRTRLSWTAPPSVAPTRSHNMPGKKPNCAASTGPTSGPGPALAAKW